MVEVVERYRKIAREYVKALEDVRETKRKVMEAIIKYLIANSYDLSKCTELAISRELGLPRSIVRSILSELVDKQILEMKSAGNVKPYVFTRVGIGAALDYLGLSFTREELHELLSAKEKVVKKSFGFMSGCPFISRKRKEGYLIRYRGCGADLCLDTLVKRFFEYLNFNGKLRERFEKVKQALGDEVLEELELLLPEFKSMEKLIYPSLPILPLGFSILLRNILDKVDELPPSEIKQKIIEEFEKHLKTILNKLKSFASLLEERGYEGLHKSFENIEPIHYKLILSDEKPVYRFHDEYLWATTLALRETCKIAQKIGVSKDLISDALLIADILDTALENKYRGRNIEKMKLIKWYTNIRK